MRVIGYRRHFSPYFPRQVLTIFMIYRWVSWLGCLQSVHNTKSPSFFSARKMLCLWVLRSALILGERSPSMVSLGFLWMGHLLFSSSLTDIAYHLPALAWIHQWGGLGHSTCMEVLLLPCSSKNWAQVIRLNGSRLCHWVISQSIDFF